MGREEWRLDTKLVRAGEPDPAVEGSVSMPIFQSSTFEYSGDDPDQELRYIRLNNTPNHLALHRKLAALEGGEAALVSSSGMATISTTLLTLLRPGDHLMVQRSLYGGTHQLLTGVISKVGIVVDFIDEMDPDTWRDALHQRTAMIMVESISNPLVRVGRLRKAVEFARDHDLLSMVDNTFASPVNFRPPEEGFDLSVHSCSKYLNGHSDLVAGAVIGKRDLVDRIGENLVDLGGCLDPHACFLLHRGMKTLGLRMRRHNQTALTLAEHLRSHTKVSSVHYPGLSDDPSYDNARELLDGCGGVLSFDPAGGPEHAARFLHEVRIPYVATSLGGVETLLSRPAVTSHSGLSPEERSDLGISDSLVRVSVGIEAAEDLLEDFDRALKA
ncbi:aminotransferase class I/II-fold pyridoxal phosphate-dependent enzyme [Candidatus Fermentibacteria bacterium]|nr:aminotransferase class I/II-fold pyridoxal phosphate-dependent enzyme [Candidatus Fermentibacteria bacterium]